MHKNGPLVFISYSHHDADIAATIEQRLIQTGLRCWIDRSQVGPGNSFVEEINRGLKEADYILVLFSGYSISSPWVNREWMASIARRAGVILPVRLDPAVEIPPLLKDIIYFDLAENVEEGLQQIALFFIKELGVTNPDPQERERRLWIGEQELISSGSPQVPLWQRSSRTIRIVAMRCIDTVKFHSILFELDIDPHDVEGASLNAKILWLLHKMRREDALVDFARRLYSECEACVMRAMRNLDQETDRE